MVPCYRLGHLLRDCVESILAQTYEDFEILIMDDCSPDNTPEVAKSFSDPRVRHVRNEPNLGHLRNYNKGIGLARGKYVWLISADDYLRRPYVLARYVELMERNPQVGYAFCPAVGVKEKQETGLIAYSRCEPQDCIMSGHVWLRRLIRGNLVVAAAGMVRRECYEQLGAFPLNMPWAGDWYLWCLFALHHDVAYFEEPMVCYRDHDLSMTNQLTRTQALACCEEEIEIQWDIKNRADKAGFAAMSGACLDAVSHVYATATARKRFGLPTPIMTVDQFEESLCRNTASERERKWLRSSVFAAMGSEYYWQGDIAAAARSYDAALAVNPLQPRVIAKRGLMLLGGAGGFFRNSLRSLALGARK